MKSQKHSYRHQIKAWGLGVLFVILVSGCGSSHKEDTNNSVSPTSPPSASASQTPTPLPVSSSKPQVQAIQTPTPMPTATVTPVPVATPTPTPTPVPTITPTPVPTVVVTPIPSPKPSPSPSVDKKEVALSKISAYADRSTIAPTVQDYIDAGVSSVTESNLDAINAAVKATEGTRVDTTAKVQDLVNSVIASQADTTPPVITLSGDATVTLNVGDNYTELGATAIDDKDGNVSVTIEGMVDTSTVGTYSVTYRVQDSAGNVASITRMVTVQQLTLTSLKLEGNTSTLNVGEQVSLTLVGTYSDKSTKEVDANITWIMNPTDNLEVNGTGFIATKDGNVTVQAKVNDVLSNVLALNIVWVINGYQLPPEPDPTVNNATLLGVDANGNGVRDDVEIYIIKRYAKDSKYPKTKTAIALQYAWASQKILENPTMESKKYIDDALDCQYYWADKETDKYTQGMSGFEKGKYRRSLKLLTDPILKDKIYNTRARINRKISFNAALSGNIFEGRDESIENCQTNIDELGE